MRFHTTSIVSKILLLLSLAVSYLSVNLVAGDRHAEDDAFWADAAALLPGFDGVPAEPTASALDGQWGSVIAWPHVPVSSAALPDGKLLTYSGQERGNWPGTKHQTYWAIYNPQTGEFEDDELYLDHEMFCAHLVMRADGILQTNGGRYTVNQSSEYDWETKTWRQVDRMGDPRWYPTTVALPGGDVFTVSGNGGPNTAERYDVSNERWDMLSGINWQPVANAEGFESNWWPYLFVSPEGQLFHFGPTKTMHWVDPNGSGSRVSAGLEVPGDYYPKHAGVAMYESGKILVAGGAATFSGGATNLCYTVDLNTTPPTIEQVSPMNHARRFSNAVMLPNGEVMIIGGNTSGFKFSDEGTVLTPEIWNPKTGEWREVADMSIPRNYHSVGLLLSDGTVFSGGSGYNSNGTSPSDHQDGQIYTPPVLFNEDGTLADRPIIDSLPEDAFVGSVIDVKATPGVAKFAAIRLVATTHGLSTDLRYLSLPFAENGAGNYQLLSHPNPNVMIPGYWMIFALNSDGVYSEAKMIHIQPNRQEAVVGDQYGLKGNYYDGNNFQTKKFERIDPFVDFTWNEPNSPNSGELGQNQYSVRWEGWVVPETTGTHTFLLGADDGVRLWINDELVVDDWTDHPIRQYTASVALTEGVPASVRLEWYQGGGGAFIDFRWSYGTVADQVIPKTNLLNTLDVESETNSTGEFQLAVDDRHELYVDGELVGVGVNWDETYRRKVVANTDTTIAIKATNVSGAASVIGDFDLNGERLVTDGSWKVATEFASGWNLPDFDDSAWEYATTIGGIDPDVKGFPVDSLASRIWSSEQSQNTIYLRRSQSSVGLKGTYYDGENFQEAQFSRLDPFLDFEWNAPESPNSARLGEDSYSATWVGWIVPPESGLYTFKFVADDGLRVWLDNRLSVNDWSIHDSQTYEVEIELEKHEPIPIRVEWFQSVDAAQVQMSWSSDSLDEQIVPVSNLLPAIEEFAEAGEGSAAVLTDDQHQLYVNGNLTSEGTLWSTAYESDFATSQKTTLAMRVVNTGGPGGAAADFSINSKRFGTDSSWKVSTTLQEGWEDPDFDDSSWEVATIQDPNAGPIAKLPEGSTAKSIWSRSADDMIIYLRRTVNMASIEIPDAPNQLPIVLGISDRQNTVGTFSILTPSASDPDNDTISFSATNLPTGLAIDPSTGRVTGNPNTEGVFAVTITATDVNGGMGDSSFIWTINPPLTVQPVVSNSGSVESDIDLQVSSAGGTAVTYKWNFGDGSGETSYSSSSSVSHRYQNPGRYRVRVTAKDAGGLTVSGSFFQNVAPVLESVSPRNSQTIAYEVRESANDRIWNVNPDNDTISVLDANTSAKLAEIGVGKKPRSIAFAASGDAWVVNKSDATISVIGSDFAVKGLISLTPGSQPHGLVFSPDGLSAYVALESLGYVDRIRVADGTVTGTVDLGLHVRGLAIDSAGSNLYVSRFITPPIPGENTTSPNTTEKGGEVIVLDTASMTLSKTIILQDSVEPDSGGGARGIPNYLGAPALSPTGTEAWIPSKQDNIHRGLFRDGQDLDHDNTTRAITSRIELGTGLEDYESRIDHDDAAVPTAAIYSPNGLYVYVCLEASREIAVIDNYGRQELFRFPVERAPQGVSISPDGNRLYTHNFMSRSISIHDISQINQQGLEFAEEVASLVVVENERLSDEVLLGKQLFYDAFDDRLSRDDYMSCASCHNDGGQDGRVWDLSGFGEGLRNTIGLVGHGGDAQGALHWSANFDEVQDFEAQIRSLSEGTGLIEDGEPNPPLGAPNTGRSADLDALAAYLFSLDAFAQSPYLSVDGSLTESGEAGKAVFIAQNCAACHSGEHFSDSSVGGFHNVGTLKVSSGQRLGGDLTGLDTPTLLGLWETPPYLHDGSAPTIEEAILAHEGISIADDELVDLVAYLSELGGEAGEAPVGTAPVISAFNTSATSIIEGQEVELSWSVIAGGIELTSLTIDKNIGDVKGLSKLTISPTQSATYILTAVNAKGTVSASVSVSVLPAATAPTIESFAASAEEIEVGQSVSLSWTVSDGGSPLVQLSIDNGIGSVLGQSNISVTPIVDTVYTLTAENDEGFVTQEKTIVVNESDSGTGPFGGAPVSLPGKIEAENFDLGGEGVAYSDRDPANQGATYRSEGPDIESSGDPDSPYSIGWFWSREWMQYTVEVESGDYTLRLRAARGSTTSGSIRVLLDGELVHVFEVVSSGNWFGWNVTESPVFQITTGGAKTLRIESGTRGANLDWIEFVKEEVSDPNVGPFGGEPVSLPGKVEAENFDLDGEGIAYSDRDPANQGGLYRSEGPDIESSGDSDSPYSIGWFWNGEWMQYTVDAEPGDYTLRLRAARGSSTSGSIRVLLDGELVHVFEVESDGNWFGWKEIESPVFQIASGGLKTLRLESGTRGANLDWIEFVKEEVSDPSLGPFGGTPASLPGKVEAENFDLDGEGIAYSDRDPANQGGLYRSEGPDIESSGDPESPYSIGWFWNGEWMQYTVDAEPGDYTLRLRAARGSSTSGFIRVLLDGELVHVFEVESNGDWFGWKEIDSPVFQIATGGAKTLRLESGIRGANVDWIEFVPNP